jgi:hypothetical protein
MAGDWLKIDPDLPEKPEVVRMAAALNTTPEFIVCRCLLKFWRWCDANIPEEDIRSDGSAVVKLSPRDGDNKAFVDALVGTPGFADSYSDVRWATFRNGRIELKNFGRHNGKTAKTRARNAKDQKKKRRMSLPDDDENATRDRAPEPEKSSGNQSSGSSGVSKKPKADDLTPEALADPARFRAWVEREKGYRKGLIACDDDEQLALACREKAIADKSLKRPVGFVKATLMHTKKNRAEAWSRVNGSHEDAAKAAARSVGTGAPAIDLSNIGRMPE